MVAGAEQDSSPGEGEQGPSRAGVLRGTAVVRDITGDEEEGVRRGLEMGRSETLQAPGEDSVVFLSAARMQVADVDEHEHGKGCFSPQKTAGRSVGAPNPRLRNPDCLAGGHDGGQLLWRGSSRANGPSELLYSEAKVIRGEAAPVRRPSGVFSHWVCRDRGSQRHPSARSADYWCRITDPSLSGAALWGTMCYQISVALSASDINRAFDALSEELVGLDDRAEIVVVGGAALVLLFGARETTKDVDVFFVRPSAAKFREAAGRVAQRFNLPDDWLNDAAKGFLVGLTEGAILYESPYLLARAVSVAQLLAMKLAAWRDAIDRDDAKLLLSRMSGSSEAVWAAVEPLVPQGQLDKAWYAFQDLWESVHGTT